MYENVHPSLALVQLFVRTEVECGKGLFCFPDLIAIPDMGGAMENWGLVTFRESAVLFDPSTGSVADKKLVTMIVDHELAHQVRLWSM